MVPSCHFISAVTFNEETHGVGLQTYENEAGTCEPHNSFVVKNYNGMETAAKVGGYVAPTCASLVVLFLLIECCKADGLLFGKCFPGLLLIGAAACQGITFLLFRSTLFCSNKDIETCKMGETGYRSIQACLVYAFCTVLYCCSPVPIPFSPPRNRAKAQQQEKQSRKKPKSAPDKGKDYTKEIYEQRRKEKNVKGRGVSGRSKKDIMDERNGKKDKRQDKDASAERSLMLYEPGKRKDGKDGRRRSRSPERFDEYVDTDPDGMDWSAYTPVQREAHYERQRSKKKEKKKREEKQEKERLREWERGRGIDADHGDDGRLVKHRGRRGRDDRYDDDYGRDGSEYGSEYDDGYGRADSGHDDSYHSGRDRGGGGHDDSYRSDRDRGGGGYEMAPYRNKGRDDDGYGDSYNDSYRSGRESFLSGRESFLSGRDSRDYSRGQGHDDGYSYSQDGYDSYAQDSYRHGDDPPDDDYSAPKRGRSSGGRSSGRDSGRRVHSESFSTYGDSYDRRGYRDDPSFV